MEASDALSTRQRLKAKHMGVGVFEPQSVEQPNRCLPRALTEAAKRRKLDDTSESGTVIGSMWVQRLKESRKGVMIASATQSSLGEDSPDATGSVGAMDNDKDEAVAIPQPPAPGAADVFVEEAQVTREEEADSMEGASSSSSSKTEMESEATFDQLEADGQDEPHQPKQLQGDEHHVIIDGHPRPPLDPRPETEGASETEPYGTIHDVMAEQALMVSVADVDCNGDEAAAQAGAGGATEGSAATCASDLSVFIPAESPLVVGHGTGEPLVDQPTRQPEPSGMGNSLGEALALSVTSPVALQQAPQEERHNPDDPRCSHRSRGGGSYATACTGGPSTCTSMGGPSAGSGVGGPSTCIVMGGPGVCGGGAQMSIGNLAAVDCIPQSGDLAVK